MKKTALIFSILTLMVGESFAQIQEYTPVKPAEEKVELVYDSTYNYPFMESPNVMVGQTLYVRAIIKTPFTSNYHSSFPVKGVASYDQIRYKSTMRNGRRTYTPKEAVEKQYFNVVYVKQIENEDWLVLYNPADKDTAYYQCDVLDGVRNPFITMGYYKYCENRYVGKNVKFLRINEDSIVVKKVVAVSVDKESQWICIVFEDGTATLITNDLVRNQSKQSKLINRETITVSPQDLLWGGFMLEEDYNQLYSKYGSMVDVALNRKVQVGMPLELLLISWGEPDKINRSSSGDQYVYGRQYVYVKGKTVTAWN